MIIAVDGPAGSGKSTVSRDLAKRLGFQYVDTGAMYRALALAASRAKIEPHDQTQLVRLAKELPLKVHSYPSGKFEVRLGEEIVTEAIRRPEVNQTVSLLARIPEVRKEMVKRQRVMSLGNDLVIEGRDIGTVVFPNADFKFYLDAAAEKRAERRWMQLKTSGLSVELGDVSVEQAKRDHMDQTRTASPLKLAKDATHIDTTHTTVEEVVYEILERINIRKEKRKWFYTVARSILWLFGKIYFRFKVSGIENLPSRGGFIVASNHRSFLDPVFLAIAAQRQISFMARHTLFRNPFFGFLIRNLNAHALRRASADRAALELAQQLLITGHPVVMFPEGTRSPDGRFLEPKSGLGFIMARIACPVVPTYIKGSFEAFPKHAHFIKPKPISVTFGKPITVKSLREKKRSDNPYLFITKYVMESIEALSTAP